MMGVSKVGALTMTVIAVLWAVTPAIACLVPDAADDASRA